MLLIRLQAFGSRAFYDEDYDLAIAVNEVLCELDPTFATAYYNLSISHALKDDIGTATTFLKRYEERAALLDTSLEQFDVQEIAQTFLESDPIIKFTFLAYEMDDDRGYASEYALISALINEDEVARESRLAAFNDEELQLLANGALRCTKRLLLIGRSQHYGGIAEVLELLCKHIKGKDGKLTALLRETLGMVHHRLGDFTGAVTNFDAAVKLWSSISLRRKEPALVARGYSEITLGEFKTVRATFQEVRSTSTDIRMTENFNVVTTSLTPRVHDGLAYLALRENDLKEARTQLEAAYHGDPNSIETQLLLVAVLLREGRIEEMQNTLGLLLRSAYRDILSRHHFLRLLEDHPFYNITLHDGYSVRDYFFNLLPEYLSAEVSLVTQTRVPIEQLFNVATGEYGIIIEGCTETPPADPSAAMKVAVIGTGLMLDHPCLANHVADVVDFTGEGPQDLNGSTTMQALHLLNSNRIEGKNLRVPQQSFSLLGVKVLNKDGRGTLRQFIAGLLWARSAGAQMIMTHVQTNSKDWHLVGVVRRVAKGRIIVTTAPDKGEGKVFPGMVSDQVLIAS